ncbi:MAG: phospho-sugar mutase, partial [Muribaculaceae bacterium]|nr:phospho-sugar mutase [Muribaculaceae bacterium]
IEGLALSPDVNRKYHDLKIVYTPIHGTGVEMVPASLKRYGFDNIIHVPEQDVPSGDFPTVDSPNPENASAMAMAVAKAKEVEADLVVASDPDADRIGCVIRDTDGEYVLVNGNQIVMILLNYLMTRNAELGKLTGKEYVVKTIVTTETIKRIAEANNIRMYDCYTGFKWIAAVIRDNEETARYLGGGEESYGFLAETFARDKDSVSAISLMAECLAWAKSKGMSFMEMLQDIYVKYGFSKEEGISVVRPGKTGAEEIQAMMKNFRENPCKELGGSKVVCIKDYSDLNMTDTRDGHVEKMDFPTTSNVLQYFTEDGTKVSIRPSGTEPKIKFYIEVRGTMADKSEYHAADEKASAKIEAIKKELGI